MYMKSNVFVTLHSEGFNTSTTSIFFIQMDLGGIFNKSPLMLKSDSNSDTWNKPKTMNSQRKTTQLNTVN